MIISSFAASLLRKRFRSEMLNAANKIACSTVLTEVSQEVRRALLQGRPVVAVDSQFLASGSKLDYARKVKLAAALDHKISLLGCVTAPVSIIDGVPKIGGLQSEEIKLLSKCRAISGQDIAYAMVNKMSGAAALSSAIILAQLTGIRMVVATENIHEGASDIEELEHSRINVIGSSSRPIRSKKFFVGSFGAKLQGLPIMIDYKQAQEIMKTTESLGLNRGNLFLAHNSNDASMDDDFRAVLDSVKIASKIMHSYALPVTSSTKLKKSLIRAKDIGFKSVVICGPQHSDNTIEREGSNPYQIVESSISKGNNSIFLVSSIKPKDGLADFQIPKNLELSALATYDDARLSPEFIRSTLAKIMPKIVFFDLNLPSKAINEILKLKDELNFQITIKPNTSDQLRKLTYLPLSLFPYCSISLIVLTSDELLELYQLFDENERFDVDKWFPVIDALGIDHDFKMKFNNTKIVDRGILQASISLLPFFENLIIIDSNDYNNDVYLISVHQDINNIDKVKQAKMSLKSKGKIHQNGQIGVLFELYEENGHINSNKLLGSLIKELKDDANALISDYRGGLINCSN